MTITNRNAIITTVQLFANGTVGQYHDLLHRQQQAVEGDGGEEAIAASSVLVWTLNDAQLDKLRMLTVASVARKHVSQQQPQLMKAGEEGGNSSSSSRVGRENGATSPDVEMKMAAVQMGTTTTTPRPTNTTSKTSLLIKKKKKMKNPLAIPYSLLASELHIATATTATATTTTYNEKEHMRQLEDVLIQCIYSNVISAKLDQASQSLIIVPQSTLTPTVTGGGKGGGGDEKQFTSTNRDTTGRGEVIYGSILSRDLDIGSNFTTTAPSMMDVKSMLHTLQNFLVSSNTLLDKLSSVQQYNIAPNVSNTTMMGVRGIDNNDDDGNVGGSGYYDMDMMSSGTTIMGGDGGGGGRRQVKRSKGSGM